MITLTPDHVKSFVKNPSTHEEWHAAMIKRFDEFDINTDKRVAGIVAFMNFNVLEEDLNYGKSELTGLIKDLTVEDDHSPLRWRDDFSVFKGIDDNPPGDDYFHGSRPYDKNPEKIANKIYALKYGNGDEASGDGWKFRARGCIRILGRTQYTEFGAHGSINRTPDEVAEYIESKVGALSAACWLWTENGGNAAADAGNLTEMAKAVGGEVTEELTAIHTEVLGVLTGDSAAIQESLNDASLVLSQGDVGPKVLKLNRALGNIHNTHNIHSNIAQPFNAAKISEQFGTTTTRVLRDFQAAMGLKTDGIAGNITLNALNYFK
jgi:putative chitinase